MSLKKVLKKWTPDKVEKMTYKELKPNKSFWCSCPQVEKIKRNEISRRAAIVGHKLGYEWCDNCYDFSDIKWILTGKRLHGTDCLSLFVELVITEWKKAN